MDKTQAQRILQTAIERDPRTAGAGYLIQDRMTITLACWFPSEAEALSAIRDLEPWMTDDPEGCLTALGAVVGANADKLTEDLRNRINEVVREDFQILWWGDFEDLCVADGEVQREMRWNYLETEDEDGEGSDRALRDEERAGFAEFLQELET